MSRDVGLQLATRRTQDCHLNIASKKWILQLHCSKDVDCQPHRGPNHGSLLYHLPVHAAVVEGCQATSFDDPCALLVTGYDFPGHSLLVAGD